MFYLVALGRLLHACQRNEYVIAAETRSPGDMSCSAEEMRFWDAITYFDVEDKYPHVRDEHFIGRTRPVGYWQSWITGNAISK